MGGRSKREVGEAKMAVNERGRSERKGRGAESNVRGEGQRGRSERQVTFREAGQRGRSERQVREAG